MSTASYDNALPHHLEARPARPSHYGRPSTEVVATGSVRSAAGSWRRS